MLLCLLGGMYLLFLIVIFDSSINCNLTGVENAIIAINDSIDSVDNISICLFMHRVKWVMDIFHQHPLWRHCKFFKFFSKKLPIADAYFAGKLTHFTNNN